MAATKSFEFRMSKKVAELTQVVHMLFTRNHEKEVEMEALKELYEEEIDHIVEDAKSRIQKAENKVREYERDKAGEEARVTSLVEEEVKMRKMEWEKRIEEVEEELAGEKRECQSVRDLLINAQNDIDRLRRGQSDEMVERTRELEAKSRELTQLKGHFHSLERTSKEKDSRISSMSELQKSIERLQKDLTRTKEALDSSERVREEYAAKNKQLEVDVKQARREMARRLSEQRSSARSQQSDVKTPASNTPTAANAGLVDSNDELERLRREIQKYKMELYNRENNFNRMFREKQPVFVDRTRAAPQRTVSDGAGPRLARDRTMHGDPRAALTHREAAASEPGHYSPSLSLSSELSGVVVSSSSERLPQLGPDQAAVKPLTRSNTRLLLKPKPLPRELLSAKAH